jgi:hypothetical protein
VSSVSLQTEAKANIRFNIKSVLFSSYKSRVKYNLNIQKIKLIIIIIIITFEYVQAKVFYKSALAKHQSHKSLCFKTFIKNK